MNIISYTYRVVRKVNGKIRHFLSHIFTTILFKAQNVRCQSFNTSGMPFVSVAREGGRIQIGDNFRMHNGIKGNPIGCYQRCTFFCDRNSSIIIGNNVGISQTALVSYSKIIIEDNVKIGGGTCIYTTDFHSLDPLARLSTDDMKYRKVADVIIRRNAFVGAHCIILKGVIVGENSIVGAGSVVTKSIPANEIWAGNPAKFIRKSI